MSRFQVSPSPPLLIAADQTLAQKIVNRGSTLYYKATPDVSSGSNDGNIASGSELSITAPVWLATAAGATTTVQLIDIDGMGFESVQPGAVLSNDAIEYLQNITHEGGPGAIEGTSLEVTGGITANTGSFSGLLSANGGVDVGAALSRPAYLARQVAANKLIANNLVSTDANNVFAIMGNGTLWWGAGGASALDTDLYRSAANTLKTDGALVAVGTVTGAQALFDAASATSSGANSTRLISPSNTVSVQVGTSSSVSALTANEWAGAIRFPGPSVAHGDLAYFPNGLSNTQTALGQFRLSITGATLSSTPSGRLGLGSLYIADNTTTTGIQFGGDVNLYRTAADVLKTSDSFSVGADLTAVGLVTALKYLANPPDAVGSTLGFYMTSAGEAWHRWGITSDGKIVVGSGAASPDTNLYRSAANTLKTDDALVVAGLLTPNAGIDVQADLSVPALLARQAAGHWFLMNKLVSSDANAAYVVMADGAQHWGPGGATAVDTTLYRASAGVLRTETQFLAVTGMAIGTSTFTGSGLNLNASTTTTGASSIQFGTDTNLYRPAANQLRTADQFVADDGLTTKVVAGVVSDGSFTATPASGTIAIDTTNSKIYARIGSTWKSVTVT